MIPRTLIRDAKEFPATFLLCASWIVIFVAMVACEFWNTGSIPWSRFLLSGLSVGRRFGDLSLADLEQGQLWRLLTCNFVHYSVLHLGLNLAAMYQLGTLIESWYGRAQLLTFYGVVGGLGNVVGVAIRWLLHSNPRVHSGGGSVVVLGLVGLCAVVGFRARARIGSMLYIQMLLLLAATALLGFVFSSSIDNWGHLGGTIAGMAVGRFHELWLRRRDRPRALGAGVLVALVLVAAAGFQVRSDFLERPLRDELRLVQRLSEHERLERTLSLARAMIRSGADTVSLVAGLEHAPASIARDSRQELDELGALLRLTASRRLTADERARFEALADPILRSSKRQSFRLRNEIMQYERKRTGR